MVTTYTHDAWNRLVKVETKDGSAATMSVLKQQHNGLNWRTWKHADTYAPGYWNEEEEWVVDPLDGTLDEVRYYTYDASWRLVDERIESWSIAVAEVTCISSDRDQSRTSGGTFLGPASPHRAVTLKVTLSRRIENPTIRSIRTYRM